MPSYSYICSKCDTRFELFFYIRDYISNPNCIACNSTKTERNYTVDLNTINGSVKKSDSELKTIGDLANRNRDRMTDDQRSDLQAKHNCYKTEESKKELPKGMTRLKKQPKTKWT